MPDIEIVTVVHVVLDVARQDAIARLLTEEVGAMLQHWSSLIDTFAPGCLELELDRFVRSDVDRLCLLNVLEHARSALQRLGSVVPGDYMNRIVAAPQLFEFVDRPTADVLPAFDKLAALLAGTA